MSAPTLSSCAVCGVRWFGAATDACPNVGCATRAVPVADAQEPAPRDQRDIARIAEIEDVLRGLVERVERTGGYATTADQLVLWRARQALR